MALVRHWPYANRARLATAFAQAVGAALSIAIVAVTKLDAAYQGPIASWSTASPDAARMEEYAVSVSLLSIPIST